MVREEVIVVPPERQASVRLPDGRRLAWSEWGPRAGFPVLFCTGAAMSGSLGFGTDTLAHLDLRLIAIDRPGLGRSDPHPAKTLGSWADDVAALIRAERLGRPLAVGFSQGAPFAFALAGHGLVHALAIVSGQDQLGHPQVRPLLHPDVAGMVASLEHDPADFESRIAQTATAEWLETFILETSSERDRGVYRQPRFAEAFRAALQEGFSQGARGYARDLVLALGAWPVEPEAIDVPVDLWYGTRDTSTVHSPDFGATLSSRLENATRTVDDAEGGSILWTRSHDILEQLKARLGG